MGHTVVGAVEALSGIAGLVALGMGEVGSAGLATPGVVIGAIASAGLLSHGITQFWTGIFEPDNQKNYIPDPTPLPLATLAVTKDPQSAEIASIAQGGLKLGSACLKDPEGTAELGKTVLEGMQLEMEVSQSDMLY